ncbi:MAG: gamma-glutamylcyclotransferase family protein [Catalinimonas sp.]
MSSTPELLFVYGTLMRAFEGPYGDLLHKRATFLGTGRLPGRLYRVAWYPGAVYDPTTTTSVHGELYRLPHDGGILLRTLDRYEGGEYERRHCPVLRSDGDTVTALTYLYVASTAGLATYPDGRFVPEEP